MIIPGTESAKRIFISYSSKDPHVGLAQYLHDQLKAAGHQPFMAAASIGWGDSWPERVATELDTCDHFLLLLSQASAVSEMVIEEVKRAKTLRDASDGKKPVMLTLRVAMPQGMEIPYDLAGYISRTQQKTWHSAADTPSVLQDLLSLLSDAVSSGFQLLDASELAGNSIIDIEGQAPVPMAAPELPRGQVRRHNESLCKTFWVDTRS